MKEITRIHIAKVAYEIEIDAKKALENYLKSLEAYANDTELLNDIEIRITELLAERGIAKDDVIAMADIESIENQLGEPRDFIDGDDMPAGAGEALSDEPVRKLYRNTDTAVLGGVLSGIASYFKIDPLWLRIAAVVLFFVTSGMALLMYVALCLVIPPARTAAEKLRMTGRPVTLASLRDMGDDAAASEVSQRRMKMFRQILIQSLGVISVLGALTALGITGAVAFRVMQNSYDLFDAPHSIVSFGLAVAAGVLLALLFMLAAYCAFTQKITKRLLIIGAVIIGLGLGSAGVAVGTEWYYSSHAQETARRSIKTTTTDLPTEFQSVKTLKINAPGVMTQYHVSTDAPRSMLTSASNVKVKYTVDGTTATISVDTSEVSSQRAYGIPTILMLNGPALDDLQLENGAATYDAQNQPTLNVHILRDASQSFAGDQLFALRGGIIDHLSIVNESSVRVTLAADEASVRNVDANLRSSGTLKLGKIENLAVEYPAVCPSYTEVPTVEVVAVQASTMMINQKTVAVRTTTDACGNVQIGSK